MHNSWTKRPLVRHMAHLPASPLLPLLQGLQECPLQPLQHLPQPQQLQPLDACLQLAIKLSSAQAWANKRRCLHCLPAACLETVRWPTPNMIGMVKH